jgi:HSP20 family protein
LFEDFGQGFWRPFGRSLFATELLFRREVTLTKMPAVDVVENEKAYKLTAELPGIDEKDIEMKVVNGALTIKGEKQEEKRRKEERLLSARAQLWFV